MVQAINLIVTVLGKTSLESQIATQNILDDLTFNDENKILEKCENCNHTLQLNIYLKKVSPKEDTFESPENIIMKEDEDSTSFASEIAWDEPRVLIKEEPIEPEKLKIHSDFAEIKYVTHPGLNYQIPADVILPSLENIRGPFFSEMFQNDGTPFYIERRHKQASVRVTNFDPRSRICDICNYEVPTVDRMTSHRKSHFFNKHGNINCQGCGLYCGKMSSEDKAYHTFFCPGKSTIKGLLCMYCDYEAEDYRKIQAHLHKKHRQSHTSSPSLPVEKIQSDKKKKKTADKAKIEKYLSYLSLPPNYVLPNLCTLNAHHSQMHLQPDGTSIYVGKGSNHLQVMNFDPRREKCDLCGKSQLKNKPDLIQHRFKEHFFPDGVGNTCQGCQKEFNNDEAKMAHSHFCDKKHLIKVNYCKKCNEQFSVYPKYISHIKKIHNGDGIELKYMCHLCSSTFERPTQLDLHVLKHVDPKPFKCAHCEAGEFKGKHGLETHLIRTHFPHVAKNICNACQPPALFGSIEQYKSHLNIVHFRNSKEKQECPICKKMIRKLGLPHHIKQQHTNTGRNKEKFECPTCNKIFFNKKGLEIHSVIHLPEDQRHFRCRFCDRSFNFKQHLVAHERSHTGEKPFKCDNCGKAFARKQALTDHQREHTGQGYACSVCSRMFTDRGNYRHHMKQHESQMGIKLTFNHEERRLMRLKVLTAEQALKGGLNDDF